MKTKGVRKYRKRSSNFKKNVASIAKRVVLRQAETKTATISEVGGFGSDGRLVQVFTNVSAGTGQQNRIGDRIKALGVKFRGYICLNPAVITATKEDWIYCRMVVFSAKRPISTVTDSGILYNGALDPELLNVHSDTYLRFRQDGRFVYTNKYIRFNRTVLFNPSAATVAKNELYVAILPYQVQAAGLTTTTGLTVNWVMQPYWKDL